MKRLLVILLMLLVLDQSIDFDYLMPVTAVAGNVPFDDMDSFSEYILEGVSGNDNLFSEQMDDDSGSPMHKSTLKGHNNIVLFYEPPATPLPVATVAEVTCAEYILHNSGEPSMGFRRLDYSPPKA